MHDLSSGGDACRAGVQLSWVLIIPHVRGGVGEEGAEDLGPPWSCTPNLKLVLATHVQAAPVWSLGGADGSWCLGPRDVDGEGGLRVMGGDD